MRRETRCTTSGTLNSAAAAAAAAVTVGDVRGAAVLLQVIDKVTRFSSSLCK